MPVTIHQTTVTPTEGGDVVQLYISDAPPEDEAAEIVLRFHVRIAKAETAEALERLQHRALKLATAHLGALMPDLARKAQEVE